jgi:hypothetical protein
LWDEFPGKLRQTPLITNETEAYRHGVGLVGEVCNRECPVSHCGGVR